MRITSNYLLQRLPQSLIVRKELFGSELPSLPSSSHVTCNRCLNSYETDVTSDARRAARTHDLIDPNAKPVCDGLICSKSFHTLFLHPFREKPNKGRERERGQAMEPAIHLIFLSLLRMLNRKSQPSKLFTVLLFLPMNVALVHKPLLNIPESLARSN